MEKNGTLGMYLAGFICYGKFPYAAPMMIAPIPLVLAIINCVILPIGVLSYSHFKNNK